MTMAKNNQPLSLLNLEYGSFLCSLFSDSAVTSWFLKERKFERRSHGQIRRNVWFWLFKLSVLCPKDSQP